MAQVNNNNNNNNVVSMKAISILAILLPYECVIYIIRFSTKEKK